MQIRRSEKCVWQNRTAEREENDLGLQDDRMSGNIQDIARLITRLLLKGRYAAVYASCSRGRLYRGRPAF